VYFLPASWLQLPSRSSLRVGAASAPAAGEAASGVVTEPLMPPPEATPPTAGATPNDAAAAPSASGSAPTSAAATNATPAPADAARPETPPAPVAGVLQLLPSGQSWVEVTDARGKVLISRLIEPGEAVGLDGTPPFKLKVGNADTTQVVYRGRPVELAPYVRDNVARFELK
jgi:cytoskeleton protein RodZ